jgi:hypothetical protein
LKHFPIGIPPFLKNFHPTLSLKKSHKNIFEIQIGTDKPNCPKPCNQKESSINLFVTMALDLEPSKEKR